MIQSKNDYNEVQKGDDNKIEEDEGSGLEYIENNDNTEQDDDSDRYVSNVGDSEEESGGITSWLLDNVFTPRTFIADRYNAGRIYGRRESEPPIEC